MKASLYKYGTIAFLALTVVQLTAILFSLEAARFITKPLLIPCLMVVVYAGSSHSRQRSLVMTALFFSFAGDVFLLFDYKDPLYFIFGLVSFLITHVLYIVYFTGIRPLQTSLLKRFPWIIVLIMLYGFSLVYFLFPKLGELKVPVIVYAVVICSMLLAAIHVFNRVNDKAGMMFIAGAAFFVISDSLLAVNKFYAAFPSAGLLIMFTYCAAQYYIAKGYVSANDPTRTSAR